MALDFNEKRLYTKQATASIKALTGGNLPFNEKRTATKKLAEAVAKLSGKGQQEPKAPASLYERLVNGEFNSLPWEQYFEKLKEACEEEAERRKAAGENGLEARSSSIACMEARKYLESRYDPATDSMSKAA